jgi:hypothetical protein
MPRLPREALAFLRAQVDHGTGFEPGWCKRKCREAYRIDSSGPETDATHEWGATRYRVRGAWIPGGFMWWTGGSEGHGHVAVMAHEVGTIFTVDYPRAGHWNRTTVASLERAWPRIRYAGISLDIDGVNPRPQLPSRVRRWDHS